MKIVRLQHQGAIRYGLWEDENITLATGDPFSGLKPTSDKVALKGAALLAPIEPPNIYCIGLNYMKHAKEGGAAVPEKPLMFLKTTTTLTHPGSQIVLPLADPETVDYEAELVIVIGKKVKNVSEDKALDYVLGYTCGNDVSCRGAQFSDKQWCRGKSFDTFCPLGPAINTDIADPNNLKIQLRLNGRTMQDSNTSDMIFSCRKIVSYLSYVGTLLPGTVIMTGTPEGVGFARKPPVYLKEGDKVEVEIEGIGVLSNSVVAEKA